MQCSFCTLIYRKVLCKFDITGILNIYPYFFIKCFFQTECSSGTDIKIIKALWTVNIYMECTKIMTRNISLDCNFTFHLFQEIHSKAILFQFDKLIILRRWQFIENDKSFLLLKHENNIKNFGLIYLTLYSSKKLFFLIFVPIRYFMLTLLWMNLNWYHHAFDVYFYET